ncbi:MAG: NAD(P)-dependent oxidoreductase [Bacteroidia bacterium]|nr:NAD(P)-dependent oxidoreductase [Bacteroidia bacterium]
MMRLLIVDEMHPSLFAMLQARAIHYEYQPHIQRAEILSIIKDFQGLIIRSKTHIDSSFLQHASQLKWIGRAGSGMDLFDLQAISQKNIHVDNAPEGNRDSVAEHTIGMLLALYNKMIQADAQVRKKIWNREANRGWEIKGKTIAIIGYGNVGKEVARRLQNFDCQILVYDKNHSGFTEPYIREVTMSQIFAQADIVSLHVPLTAETNQMVNAAYLAQFYKPITLINTSRGEVVVLADLCHALQTGKVVGACLDVLENEKLAQLTPAQAQIFDFLAQSPQVVLTPHVAGWTHESYQRINEVLVQKLDNWLKQHHL